jgi:hypothetical protein
MEFQEAYNTHTFADIALPFISPTKKNMWPPQVNQFGDVFVKTRDGYFWPIRDYILTQITTLHSAGYAHQWDELTFYGFNWWLQGNSWDSMNQFQKVIVANKPLPDQVGWRVLREAQGNPRVDTVTVEYILESFLRNEQMILGWLAFEKK